MSRSITRFDTEKVATILIYGAATNVDELPYISVDDSIDISSQDSPPSIEAKTVQPSEPSVTGAKTDPAKIEDSYSKPDTINILTEDKNKDVYEGTWDFTATETEQSEEALSIVQDIQDARESEAIRKKRDEDRAAISSGIDKSGPYQGILSNFMVTNIIEDQASINKVSQNFGGDWNVFFMGKSPKMIALSGILIDSPEYPFYQSFLKAFEENLIGGSPIANKRKCVMVLDSRVIIGYMMQINVQANADNVSLKNFSMSMLVRKVRWIRSTGEGGEVYHREEGYLNPEKSNG